MSFKARYLQKYCVLSLADLCSGFHILPEILPAERKASKSSQREAKIERRLTPGTSGFLRRTYLVVAVAVTRREDETEKILLPFINNLCLNRRQMET